jgi:NAD(P)H-dependent flavin oxidoreductase YrpB (nitropropane dioxygenase family)
MSDFRLIAKNPPGFLHPGIAIAASRAGALGILDLTLNPAPERARPALLDLHRYGRGQRGIRISTLFDDLDGEFLESLPDGLSTLIVETESEETVHQLVELSAQKGLELLVEAIDLDSAERAARAGAAGIIVKGHEAGGKIGEETALVLLQRLAADLEVPFYVQGGISPHAAAACSVGGAAGVVLDWQLALAREAELPEAWRRLMARLDGGETVAVGGDLGDLFRVSALPGSSALSEIKAREARLADEDLPAAERIGRWRDHLRDRVQAGEADERLVFLGQEASMAAGLAERHRTVGGILKAVGDAVVNHRRDAAALRPLAAHSSLARSHGTRFPIAQGPMTRVSDNPAFALEVAEAGGLPFLALSVLRENAVRTLLEETQHLLGDRSWGVGILGFVPLELRTEQLQVVREIRPRYALIAGGRPDQALELEEEGISTYLHVPSPGLLEMFLNQGSRKFVFEGRECGGHVGPRTSFVLWSSMIDLLLRRLTDTELADCQVLFAGGIHDARSSADRRHHGRAPGRTRRRVGALMGTAYLFTREAVETGAIVPAVPGRGRSSRADRHRPADRPVSGHAIRASKTRRTTQNVFDSEKRGERSSAEGKTGTTRSSRPWRAERRPAARRQTKGIDRVDRAGAAGSSRTRRSTEAGAESTSGLYMIGQVASLRPPRDHHGRAARATSAERRHRSGCSIAGEPPRRPLVPIREAVRACPATSRSSAWPAHYPKANDVAAYWQNILNRVHAVTEIPDRTGTGGSTTTRTPRPATRSSPSGAASSATSRSTRSSTASRRTACPRSSRCNCSCSRPSRRALDDAGYADRPFPPARVDRGLLPRHPAQRHRRPGRQPLQPRRPQLHGRRRLRLVAGGASTSRPRAGDGRSDMVVAGGVDTVQNPFGYLCFSKTQALSPRGRCRTFDASAPTASSSAKASRWSSSSAWPTPSATATASTPSSRAWAAPATASAKGLTAPRPDGPAAGAAPRLRQGRRLARRRRLVEAHGTGTVAGDQTEVESCAAHRDRRARAAPCAYRLGQVDDRPHQGAAGVAGLIKAALALHHACCRRRNVEKPNPLLATPTAPLPATPSPALAPGAGDPSPRRG